MKREERKREQAERVMRSSLKYALGSEVYAARRLGYLTRNVRVTGGFNYEQYRDALDDFITKHKAANRLWQAYGKVRMPKDRRELVAYHEAGHGVIGRVVGIPIRLVSINPKSLNADGHAVNMPQYKNRKRPPGFSEADIISTFAGDIAEQKFTGKKGDGGGADNQIVRYHLMDLPERAMI